MNIHDYKSAAESACRVLPAGFRIEDHLKGEHVWLAHLLCDMSRCSPHGIGGAAFRRWVAGVFRDGVYVYGVNHKVGLSFSSVPDAKITPGCQDSRVDGSPWPRLSKGQWLELHGDIPDTLRTKVLRIANALIREAADDVLRRCAELAAEVEVAQKQRAAEHEAMIAAWS